MQKVWQWFECHYEKYIIIQDCDSIESFKYTINCSLDISRDIVCYLSFDYGFISEIEIYLINYDILEL
jgi:hypothetical protein